MQVARPGSRLGNARFRALCERLESRIVFNTTDPVIFHATESALPGQVISLQGENYGANAELWLDRITDSSDTPNPEQQITNVLNRTGQLITAELPTSLQEGLYAVFVKNTETGVVSAAKFVNKSIGIQYLDLADNWVQQGQSFRISGKNLDFASTTTTVKFRNQTSGVIHNATVTQGSDPYVLQVTAPTDLIDGVYYDVLIANGYGGTYSEAAGPALRGRTAAVDHWGLGTAWAGFTFYNNVYNVKTDSRLTTHAVGDGVADDYAAIQGAINAASAAGGGVVYLPTGQYNANGHNFAMKSNVVLEGDGMNLSRIFDNSAVALGRTGSLFSGAPSNIGVVDLAIECEAGGFNSTWKVGGASSTRQFLLRSRFSNARKEVLVYGSHFMLVDGCEVIHTPLSGKNVIDFSNRTYFIIRNSYIQWSDGRIDMLAGAGNIVLENNTWSRSTQSDAAALGYGGPSLGSANNVVILNNTFNKLEPDGKLPKNNDGETIMNENIEYSGTGRVTSATDTTLTNSLAAYTTNSKTNWEVTIVQGKGMGQTRKIVSNDATTLTLATAWDVNPDATSYYAITRFDENYLIKDNLLQDVPRGIWVTYGGSMRNIAIVDNDLIDGQGIYLRGDTRSGGRFNVQNNILVEGNNLINDKNHWAAQIVVSQVYVSGTELTGNPFYNVIIRDNSIALTGAAKTAGGLSTDDGSGAGDGYYARQHNLSDHDTAGLLGVVFDRNTATDLPIAYSVNSGAYETTIFNSINNNVGQILSDGTMSGTTHASVNTTLAWTSGTSTPPYVMVTATTPTTTEGSATPANFRISRNGTSGNLVVNYTLSGIASTSDYQQTYTGAATILNGQSYVDLPVTAVDDLVYFEPDETLKLTLTPAAGYAVAVPFDTVTIVDNDKTTKILDVSFTGAGGGTGGSGDIMAAGGTATVNTTAGSNQLTIGNANPMGDGNYANVIITTLGDAAPSVRITPSTSASSLAAWAKKENGQWLLNGAFDFFVRRNSGGVVRMFSASGTWNTYFTISGSAINFVIDTPSGTTDYSNSVSSTFTAGQLYHVGVTFSTDPVTGNVTFKYFKKAGTGAIDTTSTADQIGNTAGYVWNPDDAANSAFTSGAFNYGSIAAFWATANIDLDTFRVYNGDPHTFGAIDSDTTVAVAATDSSAAEADSDPGTFTFTRNHSVGDLTVYYTLGGTASAGDYAPVTGSVTILNGHTTATLDIIPVDDAANEGTETVILSLQPNAYYVTGNTAATVSIDDDDFTAFSPTNADIGAVGLAGGMSYNPGTGAYTIQGAGGMSNTATDAFNYSYQSMTGDGTIIARVASFTSNTVWARTGLMMREDLTTGSKYAMAAVTKGQGAVWMRRATANANASTTTTTGITAPVWLKLTRVGNVFTSYRSTDGVNWVQMGSSTITMGATIYVGLAISNNLTSQLGTAVLDNVQLI